MAVQLRNVWVWGRAALAAAFFLLSSVQDGIARDWVFPGSRIPLQNGDIILVSDNSVSSEFIRQFGRPYGRYGHVALYMDVPDQGPQFVHLRWGGIEFTAPEKFLNKPESLFALVRLTQPVPPEKLQHALADLQSRNLHFDYGMSWPDIHSDSAYCAGFVSLVYRMSGLPDPFPLPEQAESPPWDATVQQIFTIDLRRTVSPNAVFLQKGFAPIATYAFQSENIKFRDNVRARIVKAVKGYFVEGRHPKADSLGDLIYLHLDALEQAFDGVPLDFLPGQFKKAFLSLNEFSLRVQGRLLRTMSLDPSYIWTQDEIAALVDQIADGYRDDFFTAPNSASLP